MKTLCDNSRRVRLCPFSSAKAGHWETEKAEDGLEKPKVFPKGAKPEDLLCCRFAKRKNFFAETVIFAHAAWRQAFCLCAKMHF